MDRRATLTSLVILSVVLAGCSGLFSSPDETTERKATDAIRTETTPTTAIQTETTSTTTSQPETDERNSYPPGYSASGIADPERAISRHTSALRAYESITVRMTTAGSFNPYGTPRSIITHIDIAEKRAYWQVHGTTPVGVRYTQAIHYTKNSAYIRANNTDTGVVYAMNPYSFTPSDFVVFEKSLRRVLANANFGAAERITRNGETLFRYEATEATDLSVFLPPAVLRSDVVGFNASIVVDRDGLIRVLTYSTVYTTLNGSRQTVTTTYRVDNLNATTVKQPAWLKKAKATKGYPLGYSMRGVANPTVAAIQHENTLANAQSYTISTNFTVIKDGGATSVTSVRQINDESKRIYERQRITNGSRTWQREYYYPNGTLYVRTKPTEAEEPRYRTQHFPYINIYHAPETRLKSVNQFLGTVSDGPAEQITRNGESLFRYEATTVRNPTVFFNVDFSNITAVNYTTTVDREGTTHYGYEPIGSRNMSPIFGENVSSLNVIAFNASVVVDRDGVVRTLTWSVTYTTPNDKRATAIYTYRIRNLNTTDIEKPNWIDEAQLRTKQSSQVRSLLTRTYRSGQAEEALSRAESSSSGR